MTKSDIIQANPYKRLIIVDALRGFALLLIILIHFVEHFDFFHTPDKHFLFSAETDSKVMGIVFFLISGKAYSIFALLFGFSFYIQLTRKEKQGIDFRWGFTWRLTVLFVMGFIHSMIYKGDILHMYAILGLVLVPLYKLSTKQLSWLAFLLILQVPMLTQFFRSFLIDDFNYTHFMGSQYWQEGNIIYANGSLTEVIDYNMWKGRMVTWGWTISNGRYLQFIALFITGFILGRKKVFEQIDSYKNKLYITLLTSIILVFVFHFLNTSMVDFSIANEQKSLARTITTSYFNLAFTAAIMSAIILIYIHIQKSTVFALFAAYGRMSLTNYVSQAVFGVIFFYEFGLAMYKYLGTTWSLLLGVLVFFLQAYISRYWSMHFYYGPIEWIWRAATFGDFGLKFKRGNEIIASLVKNT